MTHETAKLIKESFDYVNKKYEAEAFEDGIKKEFFFEHNLIKDLAKDNYKELQKKCIQIFQFPGQGDKLGYSTGEYLENFEINGFLHKATTEPGSSGSPILYFSF